MQSCGQCIYDNLPYKPICTCIMARGVTKGYRFIGRCPKFFQLIITLPLSIKCICRSIPWGCCSILREGHSEAQRHSLGVGGMRRRRSRRPRASKMCFIGERSGDIAGHGNTEISICCRNCRVIRVVLGQALSCWKIIPGP